MRIRSHSDLLPTDCVCILTFADFELRYSITSESGDGHLRFAPYAFGLRTAPYRGDCDVSCIFGNGFTCHGRNECPDQRGLYSWPPEAAFGWIVVMAPHRDQLHCATLPKTPGPGLSARCLRPGGEKSRVMLYLMRNVIISQEASHANHHHH